MNIKILVINVLYCHNNNNYYYMYLVFGQQPTICWGCFRYCYCSADWMTHLTVRPFLSLSLFHLSMFMSMNVCSLPRFHGSIHFNVQLRQNILKHIHR